MTPTRRTAGTAIASRLLLLLCFVVAVLPHLAMAQDRGERITLSLDGEWLVGETAGGAAPPRTIAHRAPVPGLVHLATPAFRDVDQFESRSYLANVINDGQRPASEATTTAGRTRQTRGYFWYTRTFVAPARHPRAFVRVAKAQFGSELWLNGQRIGGHVGCAASETYDVTDAIRWAGANRITIRVGAHPGMLPPGGPCGIDMEKTRWTPGIYDDVTAFFTGPVVIAATQVAPHLSPRSITIETTLRNTADAPIAVELRSAVRGWRQAAAIGTAIRAVRLARGETRIVRDEIALPNAGLWSPDHPQLYAVQSRITGDAVVTRFGLRELRFDTASRLAYLNGEPIFLRGTNIALHRFFEDPRSGRLPWSDA